MKRSKKFLIAITASIIGVSAIYTAIWHGLYHLKWKPHITDDLIYMDELSAGTPFRFYEKTVGTDNYDLCVPRFPYYLLYGGFASAQDIGGDKPCNPNGLDVDIMGNVYFNALSGRVERYVFYISSYITTEQYEEGQNYAYELDSSGRLINQEELSTNALALYDHTKAELDSIMANENLFFNIQT